MPQEPNDLSKKYKFIQVYQNYLEHARHEYLKSVGLDFCAFAQKDRPEIPAEIGSLLDHA